MENQRRGGLRRFITMWIGAVLLSFGLLLGGLLYAVPRLNAKTQQVFFDSRSLQTNELFELALLAQAREELLRQSTGASPIGAEAVWAKQTDTYLATLQQQADSAAEVAVVAEIARAYAPVRQMALSPAHDSRAMQAAIDRLLDAVHRNREINTQQMDATLLASRRLDELIARWVLGLTLVASALLLAGSGLLWRRVFTPVLGLARTVREFGGGDLQARAPVLRDDEMGDLCGTFNTMAAAIGEREKERLRFVATVAHDLRNPLVVIGGAAHLLHAKDARLTPDERARWLKSIETNTHKIEAMIGDLMDGVQAETGQLVFDMKPLDWAALAREVTTEHAASVQTHLIRFQNSGPCPIEGDAKRLERVLMNLLSNALKYSPVGSEVDVQLKNCGARALLTVRDEGAGIAPEELPCLFLPFSRLERTQKMASGTGLGLSSVKKIVEGHGGTVHIQSQMNVGTTIEIALPLCKTPGA